MDKADDVAGIGNSDDASHAPRSYEPPVLTVLGTLAELTKGTIPITSDGLGPGSVL